MILYLIKFTGCLAIFIVFYKLFLERETMHQIKRYFLLAALVLALGIPLITFTQYIEPNPVEVFSEPTQDFVMVTEVAETPSQINNIPIILWTIYGLGVLVFGVKFILNLFRIVNKIKHNPRCENRPFINVLLEDLMTPHTFFNYIFLNKQKFEAQEIPREVFIHEQTHAKQKHSIDVLFIELLQVVFWFNPLLYFIKKDIKLNHEFLADQAVLNNGIEPSAYQNLLLTFSLKDTQIEMANAINYSSIKKRFKVMKTHTSKKSIWLRTLLFLPLVAVTLYGFSQKKELTIETSSKTIIESIDLFLNEKGELLLNDKLILLSDIENMNQKFNKLIVSVKTYPGIDKDTITSLMSSFKNIGLKKYTICSSEEIIPAYFEENNQNEKSQQEATSEEIAEYNKLAKHINSQDPNRTIIKQKDVERMEYIYKKMSKQQKTDAEPFPNMAHTAPPVMDTIFSYNRLAKRIISIPNNRKNNIDYLNKIYNEMSSDLKNKVNPPSQIIEEANLNKTETTKETQTKEYKTGFLDVNDETLFYTIIANKTTYYNQKGYIVNKNGELLNGTTQTNASDVIPGQYIMKVYQNDKVVTNFKNNLPENN